jgi:hypothetical protein
MPFRNEEKNQKGNQTPETPIVNQTGKCSLLHEGSLIGDVGEPDQSYLYLLIDNK